MGRDDDEPTLGEAWQMLAARMGVAVEDRGKRSIRATGTVKGRGFFVDIHGEQQGNEFLRSFAEHTRRNRPSVAWRTELAVGCTNPAGVVGTLVSFIDIQDPNWDPRNFDRTHCRKVLTDPPALAGWIVSPSIHQQLMTPIGDIRIAIEPAAVRLVDEGRSDLDDGSFVAGSVVHQHPGPPVPWPERALVGPPWWVLLLCEIAETVDAIPPGVTGRS